MPSLSGPTNSIWAYWGNPAQTTPLSWSTNGQVWVPPFLGARPYEVVYHLKEGALPFADSTLQRPALAGVAPGTAPGMVGTGAAFTGAEWLDAGFTDIGDVFTLSAWVNVPIGTSDQQTIWCNQHGGYGQAGFALFINTYKQADQSIDLASGDGVNGNESTTAIGTVPAGQWHLISATINRTNSAALFYVDANLVGSSSSIVSTFPTFGDLTCGALTNGGGALFHGTMDEARIQQGNSSANWIWADYMTVAQNSTFEKYSSVSGPATISAQLINGKLVLTWPSGTLLQAPTVTGPWTTNNATSPYTNTPSAPQEYYRVRVH